MNEVSAVQALGLGVRRVAGLCYSVSDVFAARGLHWKVKAWGMKVQENVGRRELDSEIKGSCSCLGANGVRKRPVTG